MNITAAEMKGIFSAWADKMSKNVTRLVELDSVAGDGDLGLAMSDGFCAVAAAMRSSDETDLGKLLYLAGKTLSAAAPSTTGTLLAAGFINSAKALRGANEIGVDGRLAQMMDAILAGIISLGGAKRGEKTIVDGLAPAVDMLNASNPEKNLVQTVKEAMEASRLGAERTIGMVAVHGRAAIRGEDSRNMIDPGAVVASLMFEAMSDYLESLQGSR